MSNAQIFDGAVAWDQEPSTANRGRSRWRLALQGASILVVSALLWVAMAIDGERADAQNSGGSGVALADIQLRDKLIADQESLLNVYRCQYDVDTHIVPGGCTSGKPAQDPATPNPFSGTPTQQDMEIRDQLIVTQEALLNAYRCLYNVDTHVVPGGCVGTKPAQDPTESQTTPTSTSTPTPTPTSTPQVDSSQPQVQVSFASASYTAEEGTAARVTVQLDAVPNRTVVVPLTTAFHGGATTAEAGSLPNSVTFGSNEATKTIAIDIAGDKLSDPGESISIAIGQNLPNGVTQGSPSQTTISIIDFGVPTGSQPVIDVYVFYCAAASRGYSQADLTFETDRMNQVIGGFYSRESSGLSTMRFLPGGVVSPDLDWANSTVDAERTKLFDSRHKGIRECFLDADAPDEGRHYLFLVDMLPGWQGGLGWSNANFPNLGGQVSIAVTPTVESRYEGWLFCSETGGRPHRVRQQPGTVPGTIRSTIFNAADGIDCRYMSYWQYLFVVGHELGHSVYGLGHPPGCSIMGKGYTQSSKCPVLWIDEAMQTSTILNGLYIDCDDREALGWPVVREECSSPPPPVEVGFALASYSAQEGATAQVTVELDTVPFRTVTVPLTYTFQGGATAADVGTLPTSITFGPNDTTKTLNIPVIKDNVDETGERVDVSFGSSLPTDVTLSRFRAPTQTTVSFTDAAPTPVQVSFASTTYTAKEGTTAQVTLRLDRAPGRTLVIPITGTYQGTANHTDMTMRQRDVTFQAHETTSTLTFEVLSDNSSEPGEGIALYVEDHTDYVDYDTYLRYGRPLPAGVSVGTPRRTIVTFIDVAPSDFQVNFGKAAYTADEGTTAQVVVNLNAAPGQSVTIPLTTAFGGGATAADFGTLPTSVAFGPNDTTKTISIEIADDAAADPGESVQISFGTPLPDGFTKGSPDQTTVNITDSNPLLRVSFASATYTADKGTYAQITAQLDRAPGRTVVIPITHTLRNPPGVNVTNVRNLPRLPREVTFEAHETTKTLTLAITHTTHVSITSEFEARRLPAGITRSSPSRTIITLNDSPLTPVQVSFASATYTAAEGTRAQVTVELDTVPWRGVTIPLAATGQNGAVRAVDYGTLPASIIFNPFETSKTIDIRIVDDSHVDPGESILIAFGSTLPDGVTTGTNSQTTVNIDDPDTPAVEVNFGAMTYAATEGTTAQVTVQLDKAPKRTVTVPLTTAFKGGATAADFGTLPTSVTFASDATSATVSFAVTDDGISDPNESIQLSIGTTLPAKFTAGTNNQTTVSITDTGVQQLQVRLFADSSTAAEGTVAHVGVAFSADPDRILVIPFTVTFQGGATEDDIDELALNKDPVTGVLTATFAIGERNKPITFSVLTDSLSESGESVTISIGSSLPEGVTLGTPSQFTITLTDPPEVESAN
ncbi:MAG: hypothetical protein F4Y28_04230 [Acidimicrobiia bacterium]|nr:hypothetical protein [Acidimicrobiia bacterium]